MAAVVRIKRRFDEPVADSIVVFCKRQKLEKDCDSEDKNIESVFKYAGTVPGNDQTVAKYVAQAISKEKLENEYKRHNAGTYKERVKNTKQKQAISGRYNVVASRRGLNLSTLNDSVIPDSATNTATVDQVEGSEGKRKLFCLYDVERDSQKSASALPPSSDDTIMCNGVPMIREKVSTIANVPELEESHADNYVYDLYYMNNAQFDFRAFENILAIEAYKEEFIYEGRGSDDDDDDDDDDENAENNWRNDYPDEDPGYIDAAPISSNRYLAYDDGRFLSAFSDDEDGDNFENHFNEGLNMRDSNDERSSGKTPKDFADLFRRIRDQ